MPVLEDPDVVLPPKRRLSSSQIIMLLLYPVVFLVGLSVGLLVGLRQAGQTAGTNQNVNQSHVNSSVIPNANTRVTNGTVNANVNVSNAFLNSNSVLHSGGYLDIDSQTQANLNQQEQHDKDTLVDQSASLTDIVRQQDLISLRYRLKAYYLVNKVYPDTKGVQIKLDRTSTDTLYQAMKDFYGGSFNEPIDPESPSYYYGYSSDGKTFKLTSKLVSKNKVFTLTQ